MQAASVDPRIAHPKSGIDTYWFRFSDKSQPSGSTQDHPGSRDAGEGRASVKRRSPQTRKGVRLGQIAVFLAVERPLSQNIKLKH